MAVWVLVPWTLPKFSQKLGYAKTGPFVLLTKVVNNPR